MKPKIDSLPRWAERFLRLICPPELFEEIEGDLIEGFNNDTAKVSPLRARIKLLISTFQFFRPGIILRNRFTLSLNSMRMFISYFRIGSRVILRNTFFSLINASGLTLGITGSMLLFLWVAHEFTVDQFHTDKEQVYKAWNRTVIDGQLQAWDRTPRVLAPTLSEEYASVESAVSYADYNTAYLFTVGDKRIMKNSGAFIDPDFLSIFSFPLLKGNIKELFSNPASIIITEKLAGELFGDREALGETITISESIYSFPFTITGVLKDLPPNTDFKFEYLLPFKFLEELEGKEKNWGNNSVSTYVKVKKGTDVTLLNKQIKDIARKHTRDDNTTEVFLYEFSKMHLYSRFENGYPAGGRIEIMRMIGILGICIILIACINYVNLSTARAQKRCREVGVRKVTGAHRYSLITQFLCESLLITLAAGLVSLILIFILVPYFEELIQQRLMLHFFDFRFWLLAIGIMIAIAIMAGFYPAFYLSSFQPVQVLKGTVTTSGKSVLRKMLVIFQFGFAVTLIFSVVVIRNQIFHIKNREAGYNRQNLIYHFITGDLEKNYAGYKHDLLQSGFVESVTKTSAPITENWSNTYAMEWEGKDPQTNIAVDRFYVDDQITRTAGIHLIQGRDMDLEKFPSDSTAVLVNESAVSVMGFKDPIGQIIKDSGIEWHVVGVVRDFILSSPYQKMRPMILQGGKGWFSAVHIRLNKNKPMQESIQTVSALFGKHNPAYPFDYTFVDDTYNKKFSDLERTLLLTTIFSLIAVFIACLGLIGLSLYIIESRTKEIGIRKVLGGSATGIVRLLCMGTVKPILISILIFVPGAWFAMEWWLQSYEYRIVLSPWTILLASIVLIGIAVLTVAFQTIRAARSNPINALKTE